MIMEVALWEIGLIGFGVAFVLAVILETLKSCRKVRG